MKSEELRILLTQTTISKKYVTKNRLAYNLKSSLGKIKNRIAQIGNKPDEAQRWLVDNVDFFGTVQRSISLKNCKIRIGMLYLLKKTILISWFSGSKEDVSIFLEEASNLAELDEADLESIREAFLIAALGVIGDGAAENSDLLPRYIDALHHLYRLDFQRICTAFSPLERILRLDPAGVYLQMTSETRSLYRTKIKKEAKKKGIKPEKLAREKLDLANSSGTHVGFFLEQKNPVHFYYYAITFLTLFFTFISFLLFQNVFLSVLAAPILYFPSKSFVDFLSSIFIKSEIIPALRCESVGEAEKTCVVITSLIGSEKDVENLVQSIRRYRLNNKENGDALFFGLLCDLPQSNSEKDENDEKIIQCLKNEIERLNETDDSYFACVRFREYHESENAYVGWERKRGAIEQFIDFLKSGQLPNRFCFFGNRNVYGSKFLISLDSDTELATLQAKRLIGRMIHPLNRPKVAKLANGRFYVTEGFGILQPRVSVSLLNPISTPFAKIFSNGSGNIPYANAGFDSMQTLFGEGNFCGKGIIDVDAYHKVISGIFPEQRILSHDMPEGAFLRCGSVLDEYFLDSDPQEAISSDKRLHRWIRGDVQNLILFSHLPSHRRAFAVENLLRYTVPICEFLILTFSAFVTKKVAALCSLFVISIELLPLYRELVAILLAKNFQLFGRRFHSKMRNRLLNSFYQCLLSLGGIAHKAYFYSDAIIKSLFRLFISKKKLLEWQAFSPFLAKKKDPLLFYVPSLVLAVFLLFVSHVPGLLLLSLSFIFYPFVMLALSEHYVESDILTKEDFEKLRSLAEKEYLFFKSTVNENSSYLPPDNIQFEPVEKIANRTSPTNIGLYLASLISAVDLDIISKPECLKLLEKAFDSIEKLEHFQGHLYNWYDLSTLGVIGDRFVSTVDSGNYIASLIVVSQALSEWDYHKEAIDPLRIRIEKEIEAANFKSLFDPAENLFYVGIFPDNEKANLSHYDLYMSEARITSYLAIASGQIAPSHWYTMQRPILAFSGRVGIGSWTGTCFEYFMPSIFLQMIENSLEDESLNFAHFCQKKYSVLTEYGALYGISESGYSRVDEEGNLQYKAFGVPYLSIHERVYDHKVFSPYSAFLMIQKSGKEIFEILEIFEKLGGNGPMGFYESVDYHSNFIDDYKVVRSYMAHHKGMSFLSLANALCDNKNVSRFMTRKGFGEKRELLGERFPIEGKIYRKKKEVREKRKKYSLENEQLSPMNPQARLGRMLSDGKVTLISYDNGDNRVIFDSVDLFDPERGGIRCTVRSENETIAFQNCDHNSGKFRYSPTGIDYIIVQDKKSLAMKLSPVYGKKAFFLRLELSGFSQPCRVEIDFNFLLLKKKVYDAHPAFHNLSVEGTSNGTQLVLRRRGINEHREIRVLSPHKFKVKFSESNELERFEKQMFVQSEVKMIFTLSSAESGVIPLLFDFNHNSSLKMDDCFDGSYNLLKNIQQSAVQKVSRMNDVCKITGESEERFREMLLLLKQKPNYYLSNQETKSMDFLWQNGVSGDFPIVSVVFDSAENNGVEKVGQYLSAYKKMTLSGAADFDLVILHQNHNGYFDPSRDLLSDLVSDLRCDFMIGKHPGVHFVSCEEKDFAVWEGLSALFSKNGESQLEKIPEREISPMCLNFESDVPSKTVGKLINNGFLIDKVSYNPDVPFSHIVSNSRFGFVCNQNSLGFTWNRNAGLNRISKWNNLPKETDGEKIYLEFEGNRYDLLQIASKVTYLDSCIRYQGEILGTTYSVIATLLEKQAAKCISVNFGTLPPKNSRIGYSFIPCLGNRPNRNVFLEKKERFVILKPSICNEYDDIAFIYAPKNELVISKASERLVFDTECDAENIFVLGGISGAIHFEYLREELNREVEEQKSRAIKVKSSDSSVDSSLDFWLEYQVLHARFLGRTGLYQSSGAYGFRDQLQDCLAFLKSAPERTKIHLIRCAAHQFGEGDVLHWWHTTRNRARLDQGVRSRCSDDYLWLLYGVDAYIQKTKDFTILKQQIPFLNASILNENESEQYLTPAKGESGTMLEHLERGARLFISRGLEEHNLPPIGSGDWNDGMNFIDGESVWLGFFGAICLNRIKKYVSSPLRIEIDRFLESLSSGLSSSFNGIWFVRAYRNNGQIFGNDVSMEEECSIDLITQAFSAFYALEFFGTKFALDETAVCRALNAAFDNLVDEKHRVIKLFTKPFENYNPSPGYIQRYCAGVRENGGQYTHAAVWFGMALLEFSIKTKDESMMEKAKTVKNLLDPTVYIDVDLFKRYRREPYVLCGDVYDAKGYRGHGGWSWYTGAAGWYLQLLDEWKKFENEKDKRTGIS